MADNLRLFPPSSLDRAGMAAFVQQLNRRLEQIVANFEKRDKSPTLSTDLDAGNNRVKNVGRAVSDDDALPLGQLADAIDDLDRKEKDTSENDGTGPSSNSRTSRRRKEIENVANDALQNAAGTTVPPADATAGLVGTTLDPILFALSDHTHQGVAAVRSNSGTENLRRRINFLNGTNVTITQADNPANDETQITINAAGGGGGATVTKASFSVTTAVVAWRVDRTVLDVNVLNTSIILVQAFSTSDPDVEQFNAFAYAISAGQFNLAVISQDGPYDFNNGYVFSYIVVN